MIRTLIKRLCLCVGWSLLAVIPCLAKDGEALWAQEEKQKTVNFGDPFILLHDDTYYAYGTGATDQGFEVYTSDDLKTWKYRGLALRKDDVWSDHDFWAPEVYEVNGKFYMYYTAEAQICVATASSPEGPFVQEWKKPLIDDEKCIDCSLFMDDGKPYLFFDRFNDGLNVWVAELEDNLTTLKKETMRPCIHVSQPWEEVWPRVNEGPFVIKHGGLYYMTYSANSYESPFYGVGCATATCPTGPWTKYEENPLLQNPGELVGVGHSAMFTDKAGKLRIVFHAHKDKNNIHPRAMYISEVYFENVDGTPRMRISRDYLVPVVEE